LALLLRPARHAPVGRSELDGVVDKVGYNLLYSVGVRPDRREPGRQSALQVQAGALGLRAQAFHRVQEQCFRRRRSKLQRHLPGLDARELEQFLDHLREGIHLRLDEVQEPLRRRRIV